MADDSVYIPAWLKTCPMDLETLAKEFRFQVEREVERRINEWKATHYPPATRPGPHANYRISTVRTSLPHHRSRRPRKRGPGRKPP